MVCHCLSVAAVVIVFHDAPSLLLLLLEKDPFHAQHGQDDQQADGPATGPTGPPRGSWADVHVFGIHMHVLACVCVYVCM